MPHAFVREGAADLSINSMVFVIFVIKGIGIGWGREKRNSFSALASRLTN